jgi:hypothetical protein
MTLLSSQQLQTLWPGEVILDPFGKRCGGNNVQNLKRRRGRQSQLVAEKRPAAKSSGRWLIGDRGALAVVLKRENAWGVNEV